MSADTGDVIIEPFWAKLERHIDNFELKDIDVNFKCGRE